MSTLLLVLIPVHRVINGRAAKFRKRRVCKIKTVSAPVYRGGQKKRLPAINLFLLPRADDIFAVQ